MYHNISAVVGKGQNDFAKAVDLLFNFEMLKNLDWIELFTMDSSNDKDNKGYSSLKNGTTVATHSRFYDTFLWSLNPCRIVCISKNQPYYVDNSDFANKTTKPTIKTKDVNKVSKSLFTTIIDHAILKPLKISKKHENKKIGKLSQISYSTLQSHLLAGNFYFKYCNLFKKKKKSY
jgi:hypothetical protein